MLFFTEFTLILPFNHFFWGEGSGKHELCLCRQLGFAWTAQALISDWDDQLPSAPGVTGFCEGLWTVKLNPVWLND